MKVRLMAISVATLALSVGCVDGYDYSNVEDDRFATLSPRGVAEGALRADVPGFVTTEGPGTIESFDEGSFSEVIVTRNDGNRQAMGIVMIEEGTFNNAIFTEVGRTTRFSFDRPVDAVDEPITMTVMGCGGDPSNAWFDQPADEFDVVVEEGDEPMDRVVTIQSTYDNGGEIDTTLLLTR